MYTDYGQMQKYEDYLEAKAREFRGAQVDAAWLMMWLGRSVNVVGQRLLWWGKKLQLAATHKHTSATQSTRFAQRNSY